MPDTTVRPPKQQRSRESLSRVLDAGKTLLAEKGFDGFTIQDVSRRADVSVGAIYARFGSKDNLLRAVHRDAMAVMRSEQDEAFALPAGATAEQALDAAVRTVADLFRRNDLLLRAFMHLGAIDDEIARHGSQGSVELARRFAQRVLAHRERIAHADAETAVDVAFRMAYCTFARQVMYGPAFESDRPIAWERLVDEVARACAAYLL